MRNAARARSRDEDSVDLLPGAALFLLEIKISEARNLVVSCFLRDLRPFFAAFLLGWRP